LRAAKRQLAGLFPLLPSQDAFWKRRARLADQIEQLMAIFARDCPGYFDDIVLLDSTPVECGRSVETTRRSQLADACAHHFSRSHSRWFWGMRLHLLGAPDGTIRAVILASADQKERDLARRLFALALRGGETIVCDKGYAAPSSPSTPPPPTTRRCCAPRARPSPTTARISPVSASGSSRSSGRSKTTSAWKRTARAPCTDYAPASPPNSSPTAPASG
jgi:Transposase DDE domain